MLFKKYFAIIILSLETSLKLSDLYDNDLRLWSHIYQILASKHNIVSNCKVGWSKSMGTELQAVGDITEGDLIGLYPFEMMVEQSADNPDREPAYLRTGSTLDCFIRSDSVKSAPPQTDSQFWINLVSWHSKSYGISIPTNSPIKLLY